MAQPWGSGSHGDRAHLRHNRYHRPYHDQQQRWQPRGGGQNRNTHGGRGRHQGQNQWNSNGGRREDYDARGGQDSGYRGHQDGDGYPRNDDRGHHNQRPTDSNRYYGVPQEDIHSSSTSFARQNHVPALPPNVDNYRSSVEQEPPSDQRVAKRIKVEDAPPSRIQNITFDSVVNDQPPSPLREPESMEVEPEAPQDARKPAAATNHPPRVKQEEEEEEEESSEEAQQPLPEGSTFEDVKFYNQLYAQVPTDVKDRHAFLQYDFPEGKPRVPATLGWQEKKVATADRIAEAFLDAEERAFKAKQGGISDDDNSSTRSTTTIERDTATGDFKKEHIGCLEVKDVEKFIRALPTNLFLTVGFEANDSNPKDIKSCHCPCSRLMQRWQKMAGVSLGSFECDYNSKPMKTFTPKSLLDHLNSEGRKGDILHKKTEQYLRELYSNYRGGLGHKALYDVGTKEYIKAVAREWTETNNVLAESKKKVAEQERTIRAQEEEIRSKAKEYEEIKKLNDGYAKTLERREGLLKLLGVNPDDPAPEAALGLLDVKKYEKSYADFWKLVHVAHGVKRNESLLTLNVDKGANEFELQALFDRWSQKLKQPQSTQQGPSILFQDKLSKKQIQIILSRWEVKFRADAKIKDKALRKECTGIDEGGLSRHFFSRVFRQMCDLRVGLPGRKPTIPLFDEELSAGGCIPLTDDILKHLVKMTKFSEEDQKELMKRAGMYFRALGRMLVHCLSTDQTISTEVMPQIFRNAIFCKRTPDMECYSSRELAKHLEKVGENPDRMVDDDNTPLSPEQCKKKIHERYIESRTIWNHYFDEGITLGGSVTLSMVFSLMPLKAVSSLVFSMPNISAGDVIVILKPHFPGGGKNGTEHQQELIGHLKRILKDWGNNEKKKLNQFVEYVTGLCYLPDTSVHENHKINVAFEKQVCPGESVSASRLPIVKTCVHWLSLPIEAYDGKREVFETKLVQAMEFSANDFNME